MIRILTFIAMLPAVLSAEQIPVYADKPVQKEKKMRMQTELAQLEQKTSSTTPITLFLCGDVMTGRGIDQVLPHPSDPTLYEPYMRDARGYVEIAEQTNGPILQPVDFSYIWGDALEELTREIPDLRIINLETSITTSSDYWEGKGINYRMHPANAPVLTAAEIDCCVLANNHVLDWGYSGLTETLATLKKMGVQSAGAGQNLKEAENPAVLDVAGKGRVIVFSLGSPDSGIPFSWAASADKPGVSLFHEFSDKTLLHLKKRVQKIKRSDDIVIVSIHWGENWGYVVPRWQQEFAHMLIDTAGVDLVHGHSSHHVKGIEVYRQKLILYGCGDFLNDYEGIGGYETFRSELALMYFVRMEPKSGRLIELRMWPTRTRNFKVNRAARKEAQWLLKILNREGLELGTRVKMDKDNTLILHWN